MSRKRIGYWIDVPGMYWLQGTKRLVKSDDPILNELGGRNSLTVHTWRNVLRIERRCPPGTRITKYIVFRGKRSGRKIVAEWTTI